MLVNGHFRPLWGLVSTHAQQLVKEMRSNPRKIRKFKFLTETPSVESKNIPHPPKCEKPQKNGTSHSCVIDTGSLDTETDQRNVSPIKHSLLDGCYDETSNADSFKEAVNEWRNAKSDTVTSSTETMQQRPPIELPAFRPNQNLTYFDRLMLRKYKSEASNYSQGKVATPEIQNSLLRSSVSEHNIFYSADLNIDPETKRVEVLEITEVEDSDECSGNSDANEQNIFEPKKGVNSTNLKIVTQTNLSEFFLLGTEKSNENSSEPVSNQIEDFQKIDNKMTSDMKQAWKPAESINTEFESKIGTYASNNNSDSDSDSDSPVGESDGRNSDSEDEDILTLEKLSRELKSDPHSDTVLWSDLMSHRPPTSNDFN